MNTGKSRRAALLLILLVALGLRLPNIMMPVDGWHSWRQADTAAIARNFYESGNSILYPQVDWRGDTPGYVESEFHVYPYLVSVLYRITSPNDAVGRIVSVAFSLLSILGIYALARALMDSTAALCAALALAVFPLHAILGRAFMPESAMLAFSTFGILAFWKWCSSNSWRLLAMAWLCLSLAILIKVPALYLGLPLVGALFASRGPRGFSDYKIWLLAALILVPVAAWYYHAFSLQQSTGLSFGIWSAGAGSDKWGNLDLLTDREFYRKVFWLHSRWNFTSLGLCLVLLGLLVPRRSKASWVIDAWFTSTLIYILIVAKGNYVHDYYQAPVLLPGALMVGRAASYLGAWAARIHRRVPLAAGVLGAFVLLLASGQRLSELYGVESPHAAVFRHSRVVRVFTRPEDLVVSLTDGNPLMLYQAHRKGWKLAPTGVTVAGLEGMRQKGARFFYGSKSLVPRQGGRPGDVTVLLSRYSLIYEDDDFFLFELVPSPASRPAAFVDGWGGRESWGRWAIMPRCTLEVPVGAGASDLVITAATLRESQAIDLEVWIEGQFGGTLGVQGTPWHWDEYRIPLGRRESETTLGVELRIDAAAAPDRRSSGLLPVRSIFSLPPGEKQVREPTFTRGWKDAEPWGRWGIDRLTEVSMEVPEGASALVVTATTWPSMDRAQECRITIDGEVLGQFEISGVPWEMRDYRIELPAALPCSDCTVRLHLKDLWPGSEKDRVPRSIALGGIRVEQ